MFLTHHLLRTPIFVICYKNIEECNISRVAYMQYHSTFRQETVMSCADWSIKNQLHLTQQAILQFAVCFQSFPLKMVTETKCSKLGLKFRTF